MNSALCPSIECVEGALIIGVQEQGTTSFLPRAITVDEQFVGMAREGAVSDRFRFAGNCSRNGCAHYRSGSCRLIKTAIQKQSTNIKVSELPKCTIRKNCQWYGEHGFYACSICAVITEKRIEVEPEPHGHYYYHRLV